MDNNKRMYIRDYFKKDKLEAFKKYCEENNIFYMDELKNFDFSLLLKIKGLGKIKIKTIKDKCKYFFETPDIIELYDIEEGVIKEIIPSKLTEEYLINEFKLIKNYEYFYLFNDIVTGKEKTYSDLSKKYLIHISSVRRFFIKTVENIKKYFIKIESYLIENIFKEKKSYTIDDFKAFYINEDDFKIISLFFEYDNSKRIKYYKELDKIIIDADFDIDNLLLIIDDFINLLPNFNDLEKYYLKLSEMLSTESKILCMNDLKVYLSKKGFIITENNLVKKQSFSITMVNLIIKNEYKDGIILTNENIQTVNDKAFRQFNTKFFVDGDTIRLSNILKGRNCYISPQNITINNNLLNKLKEYINKEFEKVKIISAAALFKLFKDELFEKMGIDNKFYLYGILHFFFVDNFEFKRYFIVKKDYKNIKISELLEQYILDKKGSVLFSDIMDDLNLDKKTIESAVIMNKNLIFAGKNKKYKRKIVHKNFINFSLEFKENLEQIISNSVNNNISVLKELFENNKLYFSQNGITDFEYLDFVIKYLFNAFYIYKGYIIPKNHPDFEKLSIKKDNSNTDKQLQILSIKRKIITKNFPKKRRKERKTKYLRIIDLIKSLKNDKNNFLENSIRDKSKKNKKFELNLVKKLNKKNSFKMNNRKTKYSFLLQTLLHYSDVRNYVKESNLTDFVFYYINGLIRKNYYQIGKEAYYSIKKFEFEEEIVEFLKNNLSDLFKNEEYCALDNAAIYKDFPAFRNNDLFWNQYILKLYIDKYFPEYRFIKSVSREYFRMKYIIVKDESFHKQLTDVILYCFKKDFSETEKISISFLKKYLIKKNLINSKLNKHILNDPEIQEILKKY